MNLLKRFLPDRRGTVAVTFAFASVPLVGMTGAAMDYGRAVQIRHKLQTATDAAALSAAALETSSAADRNAAAERIVKSNAPDGLAVTVSVSSTSDGSTTTVDVTTSA
jgi:Flp pilus assembly protein TadG